MLLWHDKPGQTNNKNYWQAWKEGSSEGYAIFQIIQEGIERFRLASKGMNGWDYIKKEFKSLVEAKKYTEKLNPYTH